FLQLLELVALRVLLSSDFVQLVLPGAAIALVLDRPVAPVLIVDRPLALQVQILLALQVQVPLLLLLQLMLADRAADNSDQRAGGRGPGRSAITVSTSASVISGTARRVIVVAPAPTVLGQLIVRVHCADHDGVGEARHRVSAGRQRRERGDKQRHCGEVKLTHSRLLRLCRSVARYPSRNSPAHWHMLPETQARPGAQ